MSRLKIAAAARRVLSPVASDAARLRIPVYVVGGPVRDWLLGLETYDLDVVAESDPSPLAALCAKRLGGTVESFGQFGTLRVLAPGRLRVDFATARRERYPSPACLPEVERPAPVAEDLMRRDFTINAMALPLDPSLEGKILDPYGGLEDLKRGVVRALHPRSFRDDPTRVFRAARYLCRFDFRPAPGLAALARQALAEGHAGLLSRHRLAQELLRVLGEKDPERPLHLLKRWGYLSLVFPGLRAPQKGLAGVEERLAGMALALGPARGERLLAALPVERRLTHAAAEALRTARLRRTPRALSLPAARALRAAYPRLPPSALKPEWLGGRDLERAGLKPGPAFGRVLEEAARLQWKGVFATRAQALRWLKRKSRT